jgi:hypothetical protein
MLNEFPSSNHKVFIMDEKQTLLLMMTMTLMMIIHNTFPKDHETHKDVLRAS